MKEKVPLWLQEWLGIIVPVGQMLLILLAAWLLQRLLRRVIYRIAARHSLPPEMSIGARRIGAFVIYGAAMLLILERMGVSGTVLWTAFTGFAAVGAVAFFAAWSVLSNIFCTLLIFTTRPFRLYDHIEILENGEKPGLRGKVIDVNVIYTTLEETGTVHTGTVLQVPNNLFFQRTVRRWRNGALPAPVATDAAIGTNPPAS